jgi:hypothetical protein
MASNGGDTGAYPTIGDPNKKRRWVVNLGICTLDLKP